MKRNLPVTNNEVEMKEDEIIVSCTDLKGKLTSVNPDFIQMSGFTEDELIGQPHNMVRHPDMPSAAFKDLWDSLKANIPWIGYVKNRCKNGDYYWVTANATPVTENGQVTGYMSVRYKPSREEVSFATDLYRKVNAGEASLEPSGFGRIPAALKKMSMLQKFYVQMGLVLLVMGVGGVFLHDLVGEIEGADIEVLSVFATIFVLLFVINLLNLRRNVLRPVKDIVKSLGEIAEGNFKGEIDIHRGDEVGDVLRGLKTLQIRQGYMVSDTRQQATSMLRIKTALDQVSGSVMIADSDYNIFYINNKAHELMQDAEEDFRKDLPHFKANELLGTCIDVFHKDPSHQRRLLDSLTGVYRSKDMNIGGRIMNVIANPVVDEAGKRIATVVEWIDRTAEARVEMEVEQIVTAAKAGNLSERLDTVGKSGFFEGLSIGINELVDVNERVISDTSRVLSAVAEGMLTEQIDSEYEGAFKELKENTNETVAKLRDLIGQVRATASDVSGGSAEIASSNATLNDRTQEQAAALEETASSIEEITSTVQQNADNARQANQLAVDARKQAEDGGQVASQAVEAMVGITSSSKKISDIISVIDEIAFQTNLLALNAAVEAARAGEQGRGFAVVAGEVRALAQRSAGAAKEIKELINESVETVNDGSRLVDKSGEALGTIVQSVQKVSDIIAEIAAAGQEQASGIDQINQAIAQMDNVTQQNAALVEETAAGSQTLNQQSDDMLALVGTFDLGDNQDEKGITPRESRRVKKKTVAAKREAGASAAKPARKPAPTGNDDEWEEF